MNIIEQLKWEKAIMEVGEVIKKRFTDLDARIDALEAEIKQLKSEPRISLNQKLRIIGKRP